MNCVKNNSNFFKGAAAIALVVGLSACASQPLTQAPPTDPVLVALQQSAAQIQRSTDAWSQVVTASKLPDVSANQRAALEQMNARIPAGLEKLVSMDSTGPVDVLVKQVAKGLEASGQKWQVIEEPQNFKPSFMPMLHKEYKDVPAIDVLRDLGYSMQGVSLIVDAPNRRFVLRYSVTPRQGGLQ